MPRDELARRLGRSAGEIGRVLDEMGITPRRQADAGTSLASRLVFTFLLVLLVAVPLVFSRATLEGFFLPKLILIRWLTLLTLGVWLVGWLRQGQATLRWSPAHVLLGAFSLSLFPSILGASNRLLARDEVLSLLVFVLIWALTATLPLDAARRRVVGLVVMAGAGLQALLGLAQHLGVDPMFSTTPGGRFRIVGTLGNPVFLATYLAACLPIAISVLFTPSGAWLRLLAAAVAGLGCAAMLVSGTKAAILGAGIASALVLVALLLRRDGTRLRARTAWMMTGIAALPILFVLLLPAGQQSGFDFLSRLTASLDPRGASLGQRMLLWKASAAMIRERPWFGWGPGHFRLHYLEHQGEILSRPENSSYIPLAGNPLHPHNDYMELAVDAGAPSLVLFLAFVVVVVSRGWRQFGRDRDPILLGFLGAILALLVMALFGFSLHRPTTSLLFWFLAAVVATGSGAGGRWMRWRTTRAVPAVLLVVTVAALAVYTRAASLQYRADIWFARGYSATSNEQWGAAVMHYEKGLALHPRHGQTWIRLGHLYYRLGEPEKARDALERGFRERRDAQSHLVLADAYDDLGRFQDAIEEYRKAVFVRPDNVTAWNNMGACYYGNGDVTAALERWERAVEIAPRHVGSLLNLAVAFLESGRPAEALRRAHQAEAANPSEPQLRKARLIIQRASEAAGLQGGR